MVASRVTKGVALVLSAAVATTVRTSASPLAAHTLGSRSSPCAGPSPAAGRRSLRSLVGGLDEGNYPGGVGYGSGCRGSGAVVPPLAGARFE